MSRLLFRVFAGATLVAALSTCSRVELRQRSGLDICADYESRTSCTGNRYAIPSLGIYRHLGIDFAAPAGTEVISATHGILERTAFDECAGHSITVATDLEGERSGVRGRLSAKYFHVEPLPTLRVGQLLRPGDPIGRVIPRRNTECYGTIEHVHYELRVLDLFRLDVSPHQFWLDGPGRVTCFKEGMTVPSGKAVAPLRCTH